MNTEIKVTQVGETLSVDFEKGTGSFELFLNETPTDDWRKLFDKFQAKDYATEVKATEPPARIEVTCHPGEVQEAVESVRWAVQKSNDKLEEQLKKAERKAQERSKAVAELEAAMSRELAAVKLE